MQKFPAIAGLAILQELGVLEVLHQLQERDSVGT